MKRERKTNAAQNIERIRQLQQGGRYAYSGRRNYSENLFNDSGFKTNITRENPMFEADSSENENNGFWSNIWAAMSSFVNGIADDYKNAGRTFTKKLIDQFIDSDYKAIDDITQGQEDIDLVLEYKSLKQELNDI